MALTPEERNAQRKIVGTLNARSYMWFEPDLSFCIWRDERASTEWGAGIPELSAYYETLEIPYEVRIETITAAAKKKKTGFTLVVKRADLPALTRWMPSFQKQIDAAIAELDKDTPPVAPVGTAR